MRTSDYLIPVLQPFLMLFHKMLHSEVRIVTEPVYRIFIMVLDPFCYPVGDGDWMVVLLRDNIIIL